KPRAQQYQIFADAPIARPKGQRARAPASPSPLAAELGFTRVRPHINWPKSDKSDFGWRDREGACKKIQPFAGANGKVRWTRINSAMRGAAVEFARRLADAFATGGMRCAS